MRSKSRHFSNLSAGFGMTSSIRSKSRPRDGLVKNSPEDGFRSGITFLIHRITECFQRMTLEAIARVKAECIQDDRPLHHF